MITLKQYQKFIKENPVGNLYGITDKHHIDNFTPTAYVVRHCAAGVSYWVEGVFGLQNEFRAHNVFFTRREATDALKSQLSKLAEDMEEICKKCEDEGEI